MLDFRTARTARRPKSNAGQAMQRRSVWVVMVMLMFVVFFGQQAWRKFKVNHVAPADGRLADNRVDPRRDTKQKPAAAADAPGPDQLAQAGQPILPGDLKLPAVRPAQPIDGKRLFGNVSSKLFDVLEDDAVYRTAENATFFALLKTLSEADERDIELASIGRKSFIQLHEQSADYRGEIVTVGGVVERVLPQTSPPENKPGIRKYYEVWIRPDGGRLPIVAICLDLPRDYPLGKPTAVDVSGFFYKRLGYASAEAAKGNFDETGKKNVFRTSPLVLAKTLRVRTPAVAAAPAAEVDDGPALLRGVRLPIPAKWVLPVLGAGILLTIALSAWAYRLTRSPLAGRGPIVGRKRAEEEQEVPNLNSFKLEP